MQIFLTVISGVFVFVLGQMILHFILEPIKTFNEQRADASFLLLSYRAQITNANVDEKIMTELKEMGAALVCYMAPIPFYGALASTSIFGLPERRNVIKAAQDINGIAYSRVTNRDSEAPKRNYEALMEIATLLKIPTDYGLKDD